MPEPGQAPQPSIKKGSGPAALAQGEAADVNDLVGLVPPDNPGYEPSGEGEQFLYSPSDRPKEPFSHGLPFGKGAYATNTFQSEDDLVRQVSNEVLKDPAAPGILKRFAERANQGL